MSVSASPVVRGKYNWQGINRSHLAGYGPER